MDDATEDLFHNLEKRAAEELRLRTDAARLELSGLPAAVTSLYRRDSDGTALGGDSSNTPPLNSHWSESTLPESVDRAGAVDYLEFSCVAEFGNWLGVREHLELARAAAEAEKQSVTWSVGGVECRVRARGAGQGSSYRRYLLSVGGVTISIKDTSEADTLNVFVLFSGEALTELGLAGCLDELDRVFREWRLTVGRSCVSRVDLCVDLVNSVCMADVYAEFFAKRCVGVARKYNVHGDWHDDAVETLTVGARGGDCQLRIYDKIKESAGDKRKIERLLRRVWGGSVPSSSVRFEYQVRRQKLLELNVSSLPDLLGSLGRVAEYLTRKWFRFTGSDVDRNNQTRSKAGGFWSDVRGHFELWTRSVESVPEVKLVRNGSSADAMISQAIGCLQRACAELGEVPETPYAIVATLVERVLESADDFRAGAIAKLEKIAALTHEQLCAYFCNVGGGSGEMRLRGADKPRGGPLVAGF